MPNRMHSSPLGLLPWLTAMSLLSAAILGPPQAAGQVPDARVWNAAVAHMAGTQRIAIFGGQSGRNADSALTDAWIMDVSKDFDVSSASSQPKFVRLPPVPTKLTQAAPLVWHDSLAKTYQVLLVGGLRTPADVNTDIIQYSFPTSAAIDASVSKPTTLKTVEKAMIPTTPGLSLGASDLTFSKSGQAAVWGEPMIAWYGGYDEAQANKIATLSVMSKNGDIRSVSANGDAPGVNALGRIVRVERDTFLLSGGEETVEDVRLVNIATRSWSRLPSLRLGRDEHQVIIYSERGSGMRFAIFIGDGQPIIEVLDLQSNTISPGRVTGSGPSGFGRFSAVLVDDTIMCFGGDQWPEAHKSRFLNMLKVKPNGSGLEFEWTTKFQAQGLGRGAALVQAKPDEEGLSGGGTSDNVSPPDSSAGLPLPAIIAIVAGASLVVLVAGVFALRRVRSRRKANARQFTGLMDGKYDDPASSLGPRYAAPAAASSTIPMARPMPPASQPMPVYPTQTLQQSPYLPAPTASVAQIPMSAPSQQQYAPPHSGGAYGGAYQQYQQQSQPMYDQYAQQQQQDQQQQYQSTYAGYSQYPTTAASPPAVSAPMSPPQAPKAASAAPARAASPNNAADDDVYVSVPVSRSPGHTPTPMGGGWQPTDHQGRPIALPKLAPVLPKTPVEKLVPPPQINQDDDDDEDVQFASSPSNLR